MASLIFLRDDFYQFILLLSMGQMFLFFVCLVIFLSKSRHLNIIMCHGNHILSILQGLFLLLLLLQALAVYLFSYFSKLFLQSLYSLSHVITEVSILLAQVQLMLFDRNFLESQDLKEKETKTKYKGKHLSQCWQISLAEGFP